MNHRWVWLTALVLGLVLLSACGVDDTADCKDLPAGTPALRVEGAWARTAVSTTTDSRAGKTSSGQMSGVGTSAVYMVVQNCGSEPDRLLQAWSEAADMTELDQTQNQNGVAVMSSINAIPIPAGKKLTLAPGGYHVMLMQLKKDIRPGDPVEVTLVFEKAGEVKVTAPAKTP